MQLENKVVLVTGGTRGIGKAIVEKCVAEGANVAFTYVSSDEKAKALIGRLSKEGQVIKAYKSNAAHFDEAQNLVDDVVKDFETIDVLVNNAGVTRDHLLMRMTEEMWDEVIDTNLKSVFNLTKAVQRPMLRARKGSIINMSSVVGVSGNASQANYAASKAGMIGFSKSIAQELGSRSIRCNVVAPGFIETEMTEKLDEKVVQEWRNNIPLKRGGTPEDVANAVVFFASDNSSYITGQTLQVCGGMLM